jgi:hypothetical protein
VTEQYAKLETPEAQLEYLLLFVRRSRSASSRVHVPVPRIVQAPLRKRSPPSHPDSVLGKGESTKPLSRLA